MTDLTDQIRHIFQEANLPPQALKATLRTIVAENWPNLPPWSTLKTPLVEEVQKATAGSGVVLTYLENGFRYVVLGKAGEHYRRPDQPAMQEFYTIPGGFINLSATPGSTLVASADQPEDGRTGCAREVEEEFKTSDGAPLLVIDPERLKPMDTKTITFGNGEKRIVLGMMLDLTPAEIEAVKGHAMKLASDSAYKALVVEQTINPASGKPEIDDIKIFKLEDVANGHSPLLHADQRSLFIQVRNHCDRIDPLPTALNGLTPHIK